MKNSTTRDCFDPWNYLEFRPDGRVAPCCMRGAEIPENSQGIQELHDMVHFKELRRSIHSGNLDSKCMQCPIREMISLDDFQQRLVEKFPGLQSIDAAEKQKAMIRICFTERCNLRCTYCAVSQPNYQGVNDGGIGVPGGREFPRESLHNLVAMLCQFKDVFEIAINGHGETTYFDGWVDFCRPLLDAGHRLTIISNFAKTFSYDEIDALARFGSITISMDAANSNILRLVRRKVSLDTIVSNIVQVRMRALELGLPSPIFDILSGVFDKNVLSLPQLARFAIVENISGITFWKLVKYPNIGVDGDVIPLANMPKSKLIEALAEIDRAKNILLSHGKNVHFTGNFVEEIIAQCDSNIYLELKRARVNNLGGYLLVDVDAKTPNSAKVSQNANLYIAAHCAGNNSELYFLVGEVRWVKYANYSEALPTQEIIRKSQQIEINLPALPSDGIDTIYIACGEDINKILVDSSYHCFSLAELSEYINCST